MASDTVFNIAIEHDVVALLRHIHMSTLPTDTKNELRDLVFAARFTPNAPVPQTTVATFAQHGFTVTSASDTPAEAPSTEVIEPDVVTPDTTTTPAAATAPDTPATPAWGRTRQSPSFTSKSVVSQRSVPAPAPVVTPEPTSTPAVSEPTAGAVPVEPTPTPTPEPAATSAVTDTLPASAAPEPTPVANPEPTPEPVTPPVGDPVARIAEIKHEVNAQVGNPVNLIDAHNEVGREYMNALLDAMKKTADGTAAQEVARAMARLERAFADVQKTLAASTEAQPVAEPAPQSVPETVASTPEPVAPAPIPEPVVQTESPTAPEPVSGFASVADEVVADTESVATTDSANADEPVTQTPPAPERDQVTPPTPVATPAAGGITSVAKDKQIKDLMADRTAAIEASEAERIAEAKKNPLLAEDVTSGLHQLLAEWKLFKSSGIFGTGPSGHEHPLYKKLSQLTMAAVLAGRFEGANAEIKRSITDYMNGWRYEIGVTHEPGETFEHYLRRVIRHILDKQQVK